MARMKADRSVSLFGNFFGKFRDNFGDVFEGVQVWVLYFILNLEFHSLGPTE